MQKSWLQILLDRWWAVAIIIMVIAAAIQETNILEYLFK